MAAATLGCLLSLIIVLGVKLVCACGIKPHRAVAVVAPSRKAREGAITGARAHGFSSLSGVRRVTAHTLIYPYSQGMNPKLKRYYGAGDLHFVTCSCYRRQPLLVTAERRDLFLAVLEQV